MGKIKQELFIYNDSREEIKKISMIDLAYMILIEEIKGLKFIELYSKIAAYKDFTAKQKDELIGRFYTDLNMDRRFKMIESNVWILR